MAPSPLKQKQCGTLKKKKQKKQKNKTAVLAGRAPPQRGSSTVSPVGYDFTFAFTIKRSPKVELARRCSRTHREAKQEERK